MLHRLRPQDVDVDTLYMLRINVKNVHHNAHRVKIVPPETSDFKLLYVPGAPLAPGLEVSAEIEFRAREARDYHDCIRVESDDDSIEVPLHAFFPRPELELDSFVDFGMVALGASNMVDVELRNVGSRPANFTIQYDESLPLRITPRSGVLSEQSLQNSAQCLSVEFIGDDVGPFRAPAQVIVEGNDQPRMMDINANVMEQTVDFVLPDGGGIINTVDFGSIFCGQAKTVNALLVNNGPQLATFALRTASQSDGTPDGEGSDDPLAPRDEWERMEANRNSTEVMVVRPSNGVIQPFSKVAVKFTFQPPSTPAPQKGFNATLADEADDDVTEVMMNTKVIVKQTGQELSIPLKGRAVRLNVVASHNEFNFGAVPVNEHGDLMFSLKNENTELPVNFAFNRVANFRLRPASGCLLPLQATDVYVTFAPAQLGEHEGAVMVNIHDGLKELPIKVKGYAPSIGQKKRLIGGIDKTDVDFAPKLNFVELDENGQPISELNRFTAGTVGEGSSVAFLSRHDQALEYSQSVEDVRRHFEHKQSWNQYLSNTRLVREQVTIKRAKEEKAVDIGLVPGHGLRGPVPALPRDAMDEELWLNKPLGAPPVSPQIIFDEDRLIKKKFKPAPKSAQEIHDCSTPLNPEDLHHIHSGPREMNFGLVCVQSVTKKSFSLTNEMNRSILVALSYESEDIQTTTASQVIPPGSTAGFDIIFQSNHIKTVREMVTYTINGAHSYRFVVKATVIPITLELGQDSLDFSFADDNLEPYVQEQVTISNPGNFPANFKWVVKGSTFAVSPEHGTVDAGASTEVTVTFRPQGLVKNDSPPQEELTMNVDRGESRSLLCRSDVQEAKCNFQPKLVDFGVMSVATTKEKVIKVKNTGQSDTVFFFRQCPPGVLVSPDRGKVPRGGVVTCTLALYTVDAMVYDTPILADIRCGRSIKFDFKADAQVAEIITEPADLQFGEVHIGTVTSCPLTVRNNSLFPATLLMAWPEDSEFAMEVREDAGDDMGDAQVIKDASGYKIQIDPGSGMVADVVFTPAEVQSHEFRLPLTLEGITMDIPNLPVLTATGLKPRLFLSDKMVDFGSKVVMKKEDLAKRLPYYVDITLTNNDPQELHWLIDTGSMSREESSLFTVKPNGGTLGVGNMCTIRVTFAPIEAVDCSFILPLRLDNNPNHEYLPISVQATGCYPQLTFDRREILLPTVPVGVRSSTSFYVINEGYDNLELRYKLPADKGRVPLELEFPEKMLIGLSKERLLVEVSFASKKPMSFTAKIDFLDADGNRFSVPVTGTTDNSLFTVYPFIGSSVKTHQLVEDVAVNIVPLGEGLDADTLEAVVLPISETDFNYIPFHVVEDKSVDVILRWLKATMTRLAFDSFPDAFVKSNGQLAFEVVEHLCGKKIAGRVGKLPNNKREAIGLLYAQYEELLNFLKAHGALLNVAKPEYFFSLDNFQRYQVLRSQDHSKKGVRAFGHDTAQIRSMENNWVQFSRMMWTELMYQVVKCFVLNRITPRSLTRLPGFDASVKPNTAAFQSNVYSVPENVLLHWLTYHHDKVHSVNPRRITNFDNDMCDGAVVSAVLLSHVPTFDQLKQLVLPPAHDDDFVNNWAKITDALDQLGCEFKLTEKDWRAPNPRDMLLFCMYLYQSLPQFVPKAAIEFQGTLNESSSKTIELTNPSAKPVMYNVIVDGCKDFLVGESQVQLEAKSRRTFPIEYFARFSKPQSAKLMFISTRDDADPNANALAAAMVFTLDAAQSVSKPSKVIEHTSALYQPVAIDVDVENPFSSDCDLLIQLNQKQAPSADVPSDSSLPGPPRGTGAATSKKKKGAAGVKYDALTCPEARKIKIKRGQKATISLTFLPVRLGTYRTEILFLDERVGEFTYEVMATAEPPQELDTFACQCDAKGSITKTFSISVRNPLLDKIRARLPSADDKEGRTKPSDSTPPVFTVEYLSNFLSGAISIQLGTGAKAPSGASASRSGTGQGPVEPFTFSFHSRGAGTYMGLIMLRSDDPGSVYSDVRMYAVEITAIPETVSMELEFETAARIAVTQDIPIVNRSDKPWKIQASLSGEHFSGPREIVVDPGQSKEYTLKFSPAWMCQVKGQLVLVNTATSERYQYTLTGNAEEPLAEGHLTVECQARWRVVQQIPVKNTSSVDSTYAVVTDLAMFSGEEQITVPAQGEANYALHVSTQQGGKFTGSITFTDVASDKYVWYTVEVNSTRPPPEQTLAIGSTVRQAVQVDINVENPLNEPVDFEVVHDGGGLLGDPLLMLAPKEVKVYQLIYSPLQAGEVSGAVSFLNDKVGEFWYELSLSAQTAVPGSRDDLQCELGRQLSFALPVENPTSNEITLDIASDNVRNFYADPSSVIVPPYGSMDVPVWFNPSSMRNAQVAKVSMSTPGIDDWVFSCSGMGIAPTVMDEIVVSAAVGMPSSAVLDFRNPFLEPLSISVRLNTDERPKTFEVVLKKRQQTVGSSLSLQIPYTFNPHQMMNCHAVIEIRAQAEQQALTWQFPIRGVAEAPRSGKSFKFVCKARQRFEQVLEVVPNGLGELTETEYFTHEVVYSSDHEQLLKRSLQIIPLQTEIQPGGEKTGQPLRFRLIFEPLRPVETGIELLLMKSSGGRWRYSVLLEAGEPEVDDVIEIEAPLGRGASVSFRLFNQLDGVAPFQAYFTPDSPPEFTVFPSTGVLESQADQSGEADGGTPFLITYAPREYGKQLIGRLVIVTTEMQWTYEVRGQNPKYVPPQAAEAKVDSRLPIEMASQLGSKTATRNYVKENLLSAGKRQFVSRK
eukprot:SAG25_NODE_11_length_28117_cov_24.264901_6_plen_2767_part_00